MSDVRYFRIYMRHESRIMTYKDIYADTKWDQDNSIDSFIYPIPSMFNVDY